MAKRKKKEPEPKAEIDKDMDPGGGLQILKLSDLIPDGRPIEVEFQTAEGVETGHYALRHPGSLSLFTTAQVDKLRAHWGVLFRKWNSNEATEEECDELDEVACQLVPLVSDVPEDVARSWSWRLRSQIVTLHFGYLAEILPALRPNLIAPVPPNRAARRAAMKKGVASDG